MTGKKVELSRFGILLGQAFETSGSLFGILDLFDRPWWSRVWVAQELAVARNPVFMCGPKQVSWEHMDAALSFYGGLSESSGMLPRGIFRTITKELGVIPEEDRDRHREPDTRAY